ncbi:hypothetical protein [Streptomyces sp. UG1]|uniref:hypothetical protein n=1 Tax=Streptomyces sp. UG1 TaxID=3417652 RepID=UPI003CF569D4
MRCRPRQLHAIDYTQASVDLFELDDHDLVEQVQDVITVGEFYERAVGGQIVYT